MATVREGKAASSANSCKTSSYRCPTIAYRIHIEVFAICPSPCCSSSAFSHHNSRAILIMGFCIPTSKKEII
jgi:hypothetical protein